LNSISFSPNRWTDQELGLKWLENDFAPMSALRNKADGWRLLILDGHNSHGTYRFMTFCEQNCILVLCLPSHTTHRLQPCNVGVFGPLAQSWKAEVNLAARNFNKINKYNFLVHYHKARARAFTPRTIAASFRKTGIWPFDQTAIEDAAFEPALITTTQAAQPVPSSLPSLLEAVEAVVTVSTGITDQITPTGVPTIPSTLPPSNSAPLSSASNTTPPEPSPCSHITYTLVDFPLPIPWRSSRAAFMAENKELRVYCHRAKQQMEADHASKNLMEAENHRLRCRLFGKTTKTKRREGGSEAHHMTARESIEALGHDVWKTLMVNVYKEMKEGHKAKALLLKERLKAFEFAVKKMALAQRTSKKAVGALKKALDAETLRIAKESKAQEKANEVREKRVAAEEKKVAAAEKKAEAEEKKRKAAEERQAKQEAAEAKRAAARAKKEVANAELARKRALAAVKAGEKARKKMEKNQQAANDTSEENTSPRRRALNSPEKTPIVTPILTPKPRPRPRPRQRGATTILPPPWSP
jgi:DDE superfamily endonuclease